MVLWGYPTLIYSQTGNQKSNSEIYQLEFVKQVVWRWFKLWKKSVCWVCVFTAQKGHTVDILLYSQLCCLPYWFAEEHNCDMHPYITESYFVNYAGSITSAYAIDTILACVLIFHHHHQWIYWRRILPKLSPWLWGNGIWCNTIDSRWGAKLFTLKTNMPIPMLVYGDSFQWAKYGHHIPPSSLDWTNHNKGSLHWTFWNSLIEFLHTDLDGNLSSTLNPLTTSKLDQYLSSLQEGLSETANKGNIFDQQMLHRKARFNSSVR